MPIPLPKFREILFHLLYSADFGGNEEVSSLIMQQLTVTKSAVRQAQEAASKILEKREIIDSLIKKHSKEYNFERIPRIERNILRLGVYEILYTPELPPKVAISEAIRLSRKFAAPESATFVNAVLDAIYHPKN